MSHLRLVHSSEDIERTFTPWSKDPMCLAALYRWLSVHGRQPAEVDVFLESAIAWADDWRDLCEFEGRPV